MTDRLGHLGDESTDVQPGPPTPADQKAAKAKSRQRNAIEWIAIVAGALLVAFVVRTFLFQAFYIPSESMLPTLKVSDRVLVNKLSYELHGVGRGDLVVFKSPEASGDRKDLIKRVIGLPGDTVESRDGLMMVNGEMIKESYLSDGVMTVPAVERTVIPAGRYWVMGDNRAFSRDSRFFGPILKSDIVGRAFVKIWPPKGIRLF